MRDKKVLVIGSGILGSFSISILKSEGFDPVCYERSDRFGGTWCYRKETIYGQASIMPTTVINHSKEMGAFSNFPPRKEFSNYMKHSQMYEYLSDYVRHNDCEKHIRYGMEVLHVAKADDYEESGRWSVKTKNRATGEVIAETFDAVFVATGHINMPKMPKYPGQDEFKGKIIHTHSLKEVEEYKDKKVVVVGIGCSGLDAAVGISRVAKQVYLSSRSGGFVWTKLMRNGYPSDYVLLRRYLTFFLDKLPYNFLSWYLETFYLDTIFDQRLYSVKPKYGVLSRDPSLNDHIGYKLLTGSVIQKGDITEFTENGVVFDGEESPAEIDAVIMATGYTWGYPFLQDGIITTKDGDINLYKCMYPPHLTHPTLAIVGFFLVYGPGFPLAEMQVRWASHLLSGKGKLPSQDAMMEDIIRRHETNEKMYVPSEKTSIRLHYVQYQDEIAKQFGVAPNLLKYLVTDFPLFLRLLFGPSLPYQYRLEGPGKWEGARDAIMTAEERIQWPLRKKLPVKKGFLLYILDYIVNLIPLNLHVWS